MIKRLWYSAILAILVCFGSVDSNAAIKCTAKLTYVNTSNSHEVELTLASGEELIAIGYEKSRTHGGRIRRSEVYAIIFFGEDKWLILEIPNIRADRSPEGYVADRRTFGEIETRGKVHTKSFNSEYDYTLDLGKIVED
jgi:hypothetical protein